MSERRNRIVLVTIIWQFVCLAMLECHRHLLAPVLMRWYTSRFGDPQQDYAKFETFMLASAHLIQTAIATLVTLLVIAALQRRRLRWQRFALSFALWEIAVLTSLFMGYLLQLAWRIHQIDWFLFGPQEALISFRSIGLPWLVAWLLCTVPVCCLAAGIILEKPEAS